MPTNSAISYVSDRLLSKISQAFINKRRTTSVLPLGVRIALKVNKPTTNGSKTVLMITLGTIIKLRILAIQALLNSS